MYHIEVREHNFPGAWPVYIVQRTLLHYGLFPFIFVVGSESSPSSRDIVVT